MAIRPDDLTVNQEQAIIEIYEAQPQGSLDNQIKKELKDYNKDKADIATLESELARDKAALELASNNLIKKIKRTENKIKIKNAGLETFKDKIIDRHFEINGEVPPIDQPVVRQI